MKKPVVLISGMDESLHQNLKDKLLGHGFEVFDAPKESDIAITFQNIMPDLVIMCSSAENSGNGLKKVEEVRQMQRWLPIILITKFSSESRAIEALIQKRINDRNTFHRLTMTEIFCKNSIHVF